MIKENEEYVVVSDGREEIGVEKVSRDPRESPVI